MNNGDASNEQDQEFHDLFIKSLQAKGGFEFLELTKMARPGKDRYYYMSVRNGNTIPLGRGADGGIDDFQIYNVDFERVMMVRSKDGKSEIANQIYGIFQAPVIRKDQLNKIDGRADSHYHNLKANKNGQIIFAEEQANMANAFVRKRLTYDVTASFIEADELLIKAFDKHHGDVVEMVRKIVFEFVALTIKHGKIILGSTQAYNLDQDEKLVL